MFVIGHSLFRGARTAVLMASCVFQDGSESQVEWDEAAAEAAAEAEWEAEADQAEALEEECADAEEGYAEDAAEAEEVGDAAEAEEAAVDAGAAAAAVAAVQRAAQAAADAAAAAAASEPRYPSVCEHGVPFGLCHNCRAGGKGGPDPVHDVPPARHRIIDDVR